ncbi:hypothetical protein FGE12_15935 [Aggregicoccus sp. 17bor-14]|uniref:hypothetical protein n=1 Tax=Myxococcaceae TaxID=31 RepID=UPI00129C27F4|nr:MULTISPECIES: hypothetical protein [Myxococcaceae]MBF5043891.1 hypothetical protein [Simulacricoccus sp. 17bor-14]MRI89642.1 hypothetical protein [Aggregicoccus sp. 17bor-14]
MSDFAHGLLVLGATRAALQKALAARGLSAFLAAGPGKVLRLWPDTAEPGPLADSLSAELPGSRILRHATGEDGLEVSVHVGGTRAAEAQVALRLKTAKQLSQAHAALQRVAAALDYPGRLPTLLRDGPSRPTFLALVGVKDQDVALLHFGLLQSLRGEPAEAERLSALRFLPARGKAEPFARAGAGEGGGLSGARDFRAWMEASRPLRPEALEEAALAPLLAALSPAGPGFALTAAQAAQVRERASGLLRAVAEAQVGVRPQLMARALEGLRAAQDSGERAAWAEVLLAEPPGGAVREALAVALRQEEDLAAVRALYRAWAHAVGTLEEEELLRAAHAADALERKGAYALLEHTESTRAVVALRGRVAEEHDAAARAVLLRVVEAMTSL